MCKRQRNGFGEHANQCGVQHVQGQDLGLLAGSTSCLRVGGGDWRRTGCGNGSALISIIAFPGSILQVLRTLGHLPCACQWLDTMKPVVVATGTPTAHGELQLFG
jgi:hypothetical protein